MSEIPNDIRDEAMMISDRISYSMPDPERDRSMIEEALMAERERCTKIIRSAWGSNFSLEALETTTKAIMDERERCADIADRRAAVLRKIKGYHSEVVELSTIATAIRTQEN